MERNRHKEAGKEGRVNTVERRRESETDETRKEEGAKERNRERGRRGNTREWRAVKGRAERTQGV